MLQFLRVSGAHNDYEEEEGKGRSENHPRERLKFQNFLMVVPLLRVNIDDTNQCMHNVITLCISIIM